MPAQKETQSLIRGWRLEARGCSLLFQGCWSFLFEDEEANRQGTRRGLLFLVQQAGNCRCGGGVCRSPRPVFLLQMLTKQRSLPWQGLRSSSKLSKPWL